jgi:hypothetical protein
MLINFLGFSLKKTLYFQLITKVIATWLLVNDVHIPLMYINVLWNVLKVYYIFINLIIVHLGILNIHFAYIVIM